MGEINWKYIIRPLGALSAASLFSGLAFLYFPALISALIYMFVWVHAEYDWWKKGETQKELSRIKNRFFS